MTRPPTLPDQRAPPLRFKAPLDALIDPATSGDQLKILDPNVIYLPMQGHVLDLDLEVDLIIEAGSNAIPAPADSVTSE